MDIRAICAECGHARSWHDRDAARAMRSGELASDRQCYREIGGAACRCGGFRDSGEVAMAPGRRQSGLGVVGTILLAVVLVFMGLGLLYAYRPQTPSLSTVPMSQAIQEINSGQVARVTVVGGRATLELRDGQKHQATLPTPDDVFQKAVADYNIANPTRPVTIEYTQESSPFTVIGSIFLSVLPILLLGAFFLYLTSRLRAR